MQGRGMRSGGIRERVSPGSPRTSEGGGGKQRIAGKIRVSDGSSCGPFFGTLRAVILSPTLSRCVSVCPVLSCAYVCVCALPTHSMEG